MVYQYNLLISVVCINHFVHLSANIFLQATRIFTKKLQNSDVKFDVGGIKLWTEDLSPKLSDLWWTSNSKAFFFLVIKDKLNRTAYGPTCFFMCCQFGLIDGPCHLFTKHWQIYWSIKLHYVIYNQALKFRYRQREGERERESPNQLVKLNNTLANNMRETVGCSNCLDLSFPSWSSCNMCEKTKFVVVWPKRCTWLSVRGQLMLLTSATAAAEVHI